MPAKEKEAETENRPRYLTACYQFAAAKRDSLADSGPLELGVGGSIVTPAEVLLSNWKALPEHERREWEEKATDEQKRYTQQQTERAAEEEGGAEPAVFQPGSHLGEGYDELGVTEAASLLLPQARVTKLIRKDKQVKKKRPLWRDRSGETSLESSLWREPLWREPLWREPPNEPRGITHHLFTARTAARCRANYHDATLPKTPLHPPAPTTPPTTPPTTSPTTPSTTLPFAPTPSPSAIKCR